MGKSHPGCLQTRYEPCKSKAYFPLGHCEERAHDAKKRLHLKSVYAPIWPCQAQADQRAAGQKNTTGLGPFSMYAGCGLRAAGCGRYLFHASEVYHADCRSWVLFGSEVALVKVKVRSKSACIITMEAMDFLVLSTLEAEEVMQRHILMLIMTQKKSGKRKHWFVSFNLIFNLCVVGTVHQNA